MGISVKLEGFDEFKSFMNKLKKDLTTTKELHVGVFGKDGSQLVEIATIHEFGGTITPKNVKFLSIPIVKEAKGKSPREFDDLIFIKTKNNGLLAKKEGKDIKPYYLLKKKVEIPERSFIRSTADNQAKMDRVFKKASRILTNIIDGKGNAETLLNGIGVALTAEIKNTINDGLSPSNRPLTIAMKGGAKPLFDSGRLMQSIEHELK